MSGCNCVIDVDIDGDAYPAFYRVSKRKAKKDYKCYECNCPITLGEIYEYTVVKYISMRELEVVRVCGTCAEIRDCYFCSFCYGSVWDDLENWVSDEGDILVCMLDKLSPAARAVMIKWIDDWMEDDED